MKPRNKKEQQIIQPKEQLITKKEPEKQTLTKTIEEKQELPIQQPKKEEIKYKKITKEEQPFLELLNKYFKRNNIEVISEEPQNNKKTEVDFILELPSAVGKLQYYCKAKSKKKINDSDIASAMIQGQQKKLPILVIITGEMTKKTKEMLENEFKGVKVQKI